MIIEALPFPGKLRHGGDVTIMKSPKGNCGFVENNVFRRIRVTGLEPSSPVKSSLSLKGKHFWPVAAEGTMSNRH
jgi:hypothetical protein